MAFIPPNRDAGRILYEGTMNRNRGIAGAINQFVDEGYKRQEQDKEFNAKLKVAEQTLKTFIKPKAAEFGTTPEAIDAMLQNTNLSPKERYLQIGGFLEQAITSSKLARDAQQAETQRKYTDALAVSALAQKSATDAATADRLREAQQAERFIKGVKELEQFEQMERDDTPFSIEQTNRYQQLKGNEMLKAARQAGELGMDAASFIKMTQGNRALELQQQDITNRKTLAELKAENDRLQELLKAGQKQPPIPEGKTTLEDGTVIKTVWGGPGVGFVDPESGIAVTTRVESKDKSGNPITTFGARNPELEAYYRQLKASRRNIAAEADAEANAAMAGEEEEQPDPAKLTRVSGTGTASRGPINMDFLLKTAPKFNSAEEVQAAVNNNPSLIGKIVYVGGVPMRVSGPE